MDTCFQQFTTPSTEYCPELELQAFEFDHDMEHLVSSLLAGSDYGVHQLAAAASTHLLRVAHVNSFK